jgi:hypothetical protein
MCNADNAIYFDGKSFALPIDVNIEIGSIREKKLPKGKKKPHGLRVKPIIDI